MGINSLKFKHLLQLHCANEANEKEYYEVYSEGQSSENLSFSFLLEPLAD